MLIVEGPDGAGKTTLIEGLKERYGFEVAPRVVSKEAEPMVDLKDWVEDNLEKGFQDLIFDRYRLISHFIYAPILGRPLGPGLDDFNWLADAFYQFYEIKPLVIYCLPPRQAVIDNVIGDTDNLVVQVTIPRIYDAYHALAAKDMAFAPRMPLVWDYTRDGAEEDPLAMFDAPIRNLFNRRPNNSKGLR